MKILACYKLVPEEQDITIQSDGSLNTNKAEPKISQFDLNAVEAAVEIKAGVEGSSVIALSAGGIALDNTKARKDILSRGPDELNLVIDTSLEQALPHQSARALAAAAQKIGFDLIICGDGSGDLYAQQVGTLVGEYLKIPNINAVSKIITADGGKLTVERTLDDEIEVLEIPLPALISVTADINVPKIPAMKAILAAAKKPVKILSTADIGLTAPQELAKMLNTKAPEQTERKKIIIEGDGDEQIATFADHLRKVLN